MKILNVLRHVHRNSTRSRFRGRWMSSLALDRCADYRPGQTIHGYTVDAVEAVEELDLTAVLLHHNTTGAQHLHIAREDSNNVFGVAFRTSPMDDTGVAHILEHTALCGSHKFPVRDPFFKMLTRSLSTFMNAFTASDWTMYPFSSQNTQDFYNLLSVYLDAVFLPQLTQSHFRQEGWRLEHQDPTDPESPIVFKGIVFNEMKGVFSSSQALFAQKCQNLLKPDHTYSTVSGGDPLAIPDLSWDALKDFHASHYHPSNARFYTYGDLPLERHLATIEEQGLRHFSRSDVDTAVPPQPRWTQQRRSVVHCNPDPLAPDPTKQSTVAVSYLLHDITDTYESYVLSIIGALLTQGEKAPFYRALLEANIGSDFSPVLGYDGDQREATFTVGLQGIHEDDVNRVCDIIDKTLAQVEQDGFEEERIAAVLHQIELSHKHQTEKFGLHLSLGVLPAWIHGGDPISSLHINTHIRRLQACLAHNPRYLQHKLRQHILDNAHRLTLEMHPDEAHNEKLRAAEERKLGGLVSSLTPHDRRTLHQQGLELIEEQNTEEDLSCLPTLRVTDITPRTTPVITSTHLTGDTAVQLSSQPTNGVTYLRMLCDMAALPPSLIPYVPLFCSVATKMGAGSMDYRELSQQADLKTGGLDAGPHVSDHPASPHSFHQGVLLSSFCLSHNTDAMFNLWHEIFHGLDVSDTDRLRTLIMMSASELASSLTGSGHQYAMGHAASCLTPAAALREQMSGLAHVEMMKSLAESTDLQPVVNILQQIGQHLLCRNNIRCSLTATSSDMHSAVQAAETFITALPHTPSIQPNTVQEFEASPAKTHFVLPFQVNYVARCAPTVPYTHPDYASIRVLASLMRSEYLHREIREKGGAYGGGAVSSPGVFSFFSYRDPNCGRTLEAFQGALQWASSGAFTEQHIEQAKLSVFSQVDMPVAPGNRGMRRFLSGIDDDMFQQHREALFAVDRQSLISVTDRYLSSSSLTLLGPENPELDESWTLKTAVNS